MIIAFQVLLHLTVSAQADLLLNRYHDFLLRTAKTPPIETADWAHTLLPTGRWPDIDYNNADLSKWKAPQHLQRLVNMALLWTDSTSAQFHDEKLWTAINSALDHWLVHRYQSANWWFNEIGIPQYMRDIIILLRQDLTPDRLEQSLEVMAQLRVHDDYLAGNLVWCADLGLHYGALTGDEQLMRHCRNLIVNEINITDSEGIWPDYSFQQHGRRLQMYQYGKAFLWESVRIAWQCRDTPLAFPKVKIDILTDFIVEGWQWMARGIHTVPSTMDRSASRMGELRSVDLRPLIPFAMELAPDRATAFMQLESIQDGHGALKGYRHYPYADFTAFHRPGFSFFLKTISDRTLPTESINKENLLGKLLHSGDAYLIRNGEEYFDLLPLWDWTALPGVTAFRDAHAVSRKPFVGSVDDGTSGFSAMDYMLQDESGTQTLAARKIWACHDDLIVCLISGLTGENIEGEVYTALDQCRWQDDVTVNRPGNIVKAGIHSLHHVNWIHHAGFAYIPLYPSDFQLKLLEVAGKWTTINNGGSEDELNDRIFLPIMHHSKPDRSVAGYVLALAETPKRAARLAKKSRWKILKNTADCQAVQFADKTVMAAFYRSGKLEIGKRGYIEVNQPCLVMMHGNELNISDPSHKGMQVEININGSKTTIAMPADGMATRYAIK